MGQNALYAAEACAFLATRDRKFDAEKELEILEMEYDISAPGDWSKQGERLERPCLCVEKIMLMTAVPFFVRNLPLLSALQVKKRSGSICGIWSSGSFRCHCPPSASASMCEEQSIGLSLLSC